MPNTDAKRKQRAKKRWMADIHGDHLTVIQKNIDTEFGPIIGSETAEDAAEKLMARLERQAAIVKGWIKNNRSG